jgi:hypothetical protein
MYLRCLLYARPRGITFWNSTYVKDHQLVTRKVEKLHGFKPRRQFFRHSTFLTYQGYSESKVLLLTFVLKGLERQRQWKILWCYPNILLQWTTPWVRVPEKLLFAQLVKKFTAPYGTLRFITIFKICQNWTVSWARWIQSTLTNVHFYIILHLWLSLPRLSNIFFMLFSSSHACYMPRLTHPLWFVFLDNIR